MNQTINVSNRHSIYCHLYLFITLLIFLHFFLLKAFHLHLRSLYNPLHLSYLHIYQPIYPFI